MTALDLASAAREAASELALVTETERVSYTELAAGAERALGWLARRGVTVRSPAAVAVIAERTRAVVEMLHALIAIGAPIVLVHPKLAPAERTAAIGGALAVGSDWHGAPAPLPEPGLPADERPLAILQTSGSTGAPKRVVLSRRAFDAAQRASAELLGWRQGDRWLCPLPLAHVGGFSILVRCLAARKTVLLSERWDAETTLASVVPAQLARWLAETELFVPPRLRAVIVGGAAASAELVASARARGIPALPSYGMSETAGQIATARPSDGGLGHVGAPLAGVELRILDGRVAVRGPMLASDLVLDGGYFVTDDLGRIDAEGRLIVLGRASERIVTGGENVDPLEVERVLQGCPGVEHACVFGVPDPIWGERVAVALVAGPAFDPGELGRFSERELASFKRPRAYAKLPALALLPNGKLDRAAVVRAATRRLRPLSRPPAAAALARPGDVE